VLLQFLVRSQISSTDLEGTQVTAPA
jgi:hypothetical protein